MATETTTIRIPREVRDKLAEQAAKRGTSMAAMLADFVWANDLEIAYREERAAARSDAANPDVQQEADDWATTESDGL